MKYTIMGDIHKVLAKPAVRALECVGITTVEELCAHTEAQLLVLHGFGNNGLQKIKKLLDENNLALTGQG